MTVATDELSRAPVYVVLDGEMLIDAPLKKVWVHVMDPPSWQIYSVYQHIAGEAGQEGELMLLKKEEAGSSPTPFYARTVKIEAGRRVIWKIFRELGVSESGGPRFGIVDFKVTEAEGRTKFSYHVLYEIPPPPDEQRAAFKELQYRNFQAVLSAVLPKLKRLAEGAVAHAAK